MCSSARQYKNAHSDVAASAYATEQTRLHYAWSAVERLLEILVLPRISDRQANRRYNRACLLITSRFIQIKFWNTTPAS